MKTLNILWVLLFFMVFTAKAQSDLKREVELSLLRNGGIGTANNDKIYKKVIQFIDSTTNKPLVNHYFTLLKNNMPIGPGKTDDKGFGTVRMRNSNYYNKVEIDLNPNHELPANSTPIRNVVAYKPAKLNSISFPSKKEIVDTVKFYVKKLD